MAGPSSQFPKFAKPSPARIPVKLSTKETRKLTAQKSTKLSTEYLNSPPEPPLEERKKDEHSDESDVKIPGASATESPRTWRDSMVDTLTSPTLKTALYYAGVSLEDSEEFAFDKPKSA